LPLFLELVRQVAADKPEVARQALKGLAAYGQAARSAPSPERPALASVGGASLRNHGGDGSPVVLVPSLINPPDVLDLDAKGSLAAAVAGFGRSALLLDWGPAAGRQTLNVAGHVEHLLVPLLQTLDEPAALVGYCLGGTMAVAAGQMTHVERVATLAAPWRFSAYPRQSRDALLQSWRGAEPAAQALGALPMEVLQAAFWSLEPERTVAKFASFAGRDPDSPAARRFVRLEDWANDGEPLPLPAARELIEDFFDADLPGRGEWRVGGRPVQPNLPVPALHLTAAQDRIVPAASAPPGDTLAISAGHVGMVVGSARRELHGALHSFLDPACR